jgi:hypothetical protein
MKNTKVFIYGTLLALPLLGLLYYFLNPPQCPLNYTQEQVDASRCIIGANIGGLPLLIISVPIVWLASVWLVRKMLDKRKSTKK